VAAPSGSRDRPTHDGGGHARDAIRAAAALVVRQLCDGVGHERATLGDVCRRLSRPGEPTRTGTSGWDRRAVWGLLRHPASRGPAAFGKTRQGPPRPRPRAQRGRPRPPRRAPSPVEGPREEGRALPGSALVAPAGCAAVQEPWRDPQRHARPDRRGASDRRPGLVSGQRWGEASDGQGIRPTAAQGRPRPEADDRCLGTAASRVGGARVGHQTPGRTGGIAPYGTRAEGCGRIPLDWPRHPVAGCTPTRPPGAMR